MWAFIYPILKYFIASIFLPIVKEVGYRTFVAVKDITKAVVEEIENDPSFGDILDKGERGKAKREKAFEMLKKIFKKEFKEEFGDSFIYFVIELAVQLLKIEGKEKKAKPKKTRRKKKDE